MDTKVKKQAEVVIESEIPTRIKLYNPDAMDYKNQHRVKSIELTDAYTRIDFIYRSPNYYVDGGWITIERNSYITPIGASANYYMIRAISIPITPIKHYFKKPGEYFTYSLIFPALPKDTKRIDIIEKLAPGTFFNFFNVNYAEWMTVPHATDFSKINN